MIFVFILELLEELIEELSEITIRQTYFRNVRGRFVCL